VTVRERSRPAPPAPAPAPPHPRIRARRVEVARDQGRRRRRRLNVLLGAVCAGVWALVALRSPLFDIDRVQVSGGERTPDVDVLGALGEGTGSPLLDLDPGAAARRVEALPWVADARVQRLWPGTVRVVLVERRAVAAAAHGSGWATVDATGRILAVGPTRPPGLVGVAGRADGAPGTRLDGPDRALLAALGDVPRAARDDLATIRRSDDGIVLDLRAGPCVVVGDTTDLEGKVLAATAVRDSAGLGRQGRIDVRVPSAPALTRDGRCA